MMPWRALAQQGQAKLDYALGGTAATAPWWTKLFRNVGMSEITDFFIMLTAIGGFVLIVCRIWRQWRHRDTAPKK